MKEIIYNSFLSDSIREYGRQFFLMSSEAYGRNAAFAVVDANGIQVAKDSQKGFDDETIRQIRERMKSSIAKKDLTQDKAADKALTGKPKLENWQKYLENGEYLRSSEMADEQNYNMIDGVSNNRSSGKSKDLAVGPDGRISVLERLKEKQAIVDARYGRVAQERTVDDMQRNRK